MGPAVLRRTTTQWPATAKQNHSVLVSTRTRKADLSSATPPLAPGVACPDADHPRPILRTTTAHETTNDVMLLDPHAELALHPLLKYTNQAGFGMPGCLLFWDYRNPPHKASTYQPSLSRRLSHPLAQRHPNLRTVSQSELSQHATQPPVNRLTVTCGLFPHPWRIHARSSRGVSILDVLLAIYTSLSKPIRKSEFLNFPPPKQARITETFHHRCAHSPNPKEEKMHGVRRADCLGIHTRFGGLSVEVQGGVSCVLTLDRNENSGIRTNTRLGVIGSI